MRTNLNFSEYKKYKEYSYLHIIIIIFSCIQLQPIKYAGLTLGALLYSIAAGLDPLNILYLFIVGVIMVKIKATLTVTLDGIFGVGSYG
jgi:hypothetical protein